MQLVIVQNQTHPLTTPLQVGYADNFMGRLRGLMFTPPVANQSGLLLVQDHASRLDSAIHMFFVSYDLGTVWLDASYQVVDTVLAKSWRPFYMPSHPARYTLEIHPDRLAEFQPGDQLLIDYASA